jgi:outer membrane protein OmpA-like peptidoglycan-associated protein/tetratricopeptide (TPR) repeat protein
MKLPLLLLSLLICTAGLSQDNSFKKRMADSYSSNFDFHKAIPVYEKILKKNPNDYEVYEKLAEIYDHLNDSQNSERCYEFLVKKQGVKPEYLLKYGRALSRNGKYDKAIDVYKSYLTARPDDPRGSSFSESYANIKTFYQDSALYKIKKAPFSEKSDDFSPAWYKGSIIFVSDRTNLSKVKRLYNWTQSPYLDLFIVKPDSKDAKPFSKELNTDYHEGPVTFNKAQDTIIFTRSNYFNSKLHKSNEGINKLGLFQARWDSLQMKWIDLKPLLLNNKEYSIQHPALSPDGSKLYFASDLPRGQGGFDVYVSQRTKYTNGEITWGVPDNLGPAINSPGNDLFPFVDAQGNLWFASDGIPGLGGLDLFCAEKSKDGFSKPINPGYPMNSNFDDFGYISDATGLNGYFSSDRNNNYGNDDIYAFKKTPREPEIVKQVVEKKAFVFMVNGLVFSATDKSPVAGCTAVITNVTTTVGMKLRTDEKGLFSRTLLPESDYRITLTDLIPKDKCSSVEIAFSTKGVEKDSTFNISFPVYCQGDVIAIEDIYYDLGKYNILPEAAIVLDKLVKTLVENPKMKIELRSHTDSRSSAAFNLKLSDNRAKSAAEYLFYKGIARDRVVGKGYGETMLINKCADEVPCTEAEHRKNRRTEFYITELGDKSIEVVKVQSQGTETKSEPQKAVKVVEPPEKKAQPQQPVIQQKEPVKKAEPQQPAIQQKEPVKKAEPQQPVIQQKEPVKKVEPKKLENSDQVADKPAAVTAGKTGTTEVRKGSKDHFLILRSFQTRASAVKFLSEIQKTVATAQVIGEQTPFRIGLKFSNLQDAQEAKKQYVGKYPDCWLLYDK